MAGHSKWANIKHKKAAADAVKGKVFSKIAKEIMVAARIGGGDPAANISLRALVQKARGVNMPSDNIERAIKRGTGEMDGLVFEEILYEGYAPGGVSVIIQTLSDNKNRTAAEVRHAFSKHGGNLAGAGSVLRNFRRRGYFTIPAELVEEDRLLDIALEAGAEDVQR
ncbi:MAG: YebC/PmpR family DNA-binding transcriptional regulator, partial [Kiritimatiellae bacterium]|nr:YebC/PmpR family DNA-binding transcriptional regulator [Kiritimatiellia bacterium]